MRSFNFLLLVALLIGSIVGCGRGEKYGEEILSTEVTKVKDVLTNLDKYVGKTIKVEGRIIRECPTGCWFYLQDETDTIYVNLHPSGFAIPQGVGKEVVVEGELKSKGGRLEIIGKGVVIK